MSAGELQTLVNHLVAEFSSNKSECPGLKIYWNKADGMTYRTAVIRNFDWLADENAKPGPTPGFHHALMLCCPVSSVIWAGIIYAALRFLR